MQTRLALECNGLRRTVFAFNSVRRSLRRLLLLLPSELGQGHFTVICVACVIVVHRIWTCRRSQRSVGLEGRRRVHCNRVIVIAREIDLLLARNQSPHTSAVPPSLAALEDVMGLGHG